MELGTRRPGPEFGVFRRMVEDASGDTAAATGEDPTDHDCTDSYSGELAYVNTGEGK